MSVHNRPFQGVKKEHQNILGSFCTKTHIDGRRESRLKERHISSVITKARRKRLLIMLVQYSNTKVKGGQKAIYAHKRKQESSKISVEQNQHYIYYIFSLHGSQFDLPQLIFQHSHHFQRCRSIFNPKCSTSKDQLTQSLKRWMITHSRFW